MKNSLACPKCDSRKLWRIDKAGAEGRYSNTLVELRVAVLKAPTRKTGYFSAYICHACGYTELWAHSCPQLSHQPEEGVHFIDASPQQSEYR